LTKSSLLPFIIIFAIVVWLPGYLMRDLWQPDEARYAYVAREMQQTGEWFVPHRHGEPYAHKPPMMFWLINAASLTTGGEIGRLATRLPSLLGIIMTLWATAAITKLYATRKDALRSILVAATTFGIWWQAGWGQIDMLLCGIEIMAVYLLLADSLRPTRWRPALAFLFFGLGILTKGPVGFVVPLGAYITAMIFAGQRSRLARRYWLWCLPLTLLPPALWLLAAKLSGAPESYFHELIFAQNAERAAGKLGHIRPIYYYLKNMFVGGFPWILFLPFAVKLALQKEDNRTGDQTLLRMLLGWMFFVVIFFSILPTKRSLYILLAYPALAISTSLSWPKLIEFRRDRVGISAMLAGAVIAMTGVVLLLAPHYRPDLPLNLLVGILCAAVMVGGSASLLLNYRKTGASRVWLYQLIGLLLVVYMLIALVVLPRFNAMNTPYALPEIVKKHLPDGDPILLYKLNAEIMPYYCNRSGRVFWGLTELRRAIRKYRKGVVIFLKEEWQENQKEEFAPFGDHGSFKMGHREYIWLAYDLD